MRHKLVYDITTRLESFSLNTVISGFMEYNNKLIESGKKAGRHRQRDPGDMPLLCWRLSLLISQKSSGSSWVMNETVFASTDGRML